jgi:hypothetical protein
MKLTETQLKELIQEELILNEIGPLMAMAGQGALTLLGSDSGRKMLANILRMPDTLAKNVTSIDDAILAKAGLESPGFVNKIQDFIRMTSGFGMFGKVADWIEGASDEEMKALTAAAKASKVAGGAAKTPASPGATAAPTQAAPPGRVGFQENQMNLTTERFKQIVQEELAHTTQMERKLK